MNPVNIYAISRIRDEHTFNVVDMHHSGKDRLPRSQYHEIESLRLLADELIHSDITLDALDGFFWGFKIPQIGKEFDLLKITDKLCINIELKSQVVPMEQILSQLQRNRHYLRHLGKKTLLYSVITDRMAFYKLSLNDELIEVSFDELVDVVKRVETDYYMSIDELFRASNYLVSPFNTPEKFIQGEYFLTQNQEDIKKKVLSEAGSAFFETYLHITGKPGTGKTLLLYDIAKSLAKSGKTLIIHCGKLSDGQRKIGNEIENLSIFPASRLQDDNTTLEQYSYILVDETHRIYPKQFAKICASAKENDQVCIFSSDPEQVLSAKEQRNNIVGKIESLNLTGSYSLSEKIRMNKELHSFILNVQDLNHKPKRPIYYRHVNLNYANTTQEAQDLIAYFRKKGYVFINFSKSNHAYSPYSEYEEDYDTHHVIGQEFDGVVMLLDSAFYYDENGILKGNPHPNPDYLYSKLFYQGITRVRENLSLIVVNAPDLFQKIAEIVNTDQQ